MCGFKPDFFVDSPKKTPTPAAAAATAATATTQAASTSAAAALFSQAPTQPAGAPRTNAFGAPMGLHV